MKNYFEFSWEYFTDIDYTEEVEFMEGFECLKRSP